MANPKKSNLIRPAFSQSLSLNCVDIKLEPSSLNKGIFPYKDFVEIMTPAACVPTYLNAPSIDSAFESRGESSKSPN